MCVRVKTYDKVIVYEQVIQACNTFKCLCSITSKEGKFESDVNARIAIGKQAAKTMNGFL